MPKQKIVGFEEGWATLQPTIDRLIEVCEGSDGLVAADVTRREVGLDNKGYMDHNRTVHLMSTQKPPNNWQEQLYRGYTAVYVDYLALVVVPKLRELRGCALIREVGRRWANYLWLAKQMKSMFNFLDRFYTKRNKLPDVRDVAVNAFRDVVLPLVQHQRPVVVRGDDGDVAECDWEGLRVLFGVMDDELKATWEQKQQEPEPELELVRQSTAEQREAAAAAREEEQQSPVMLTPAERQEAQRRGLLSEDVVAELQRLVRAAGGRLQTHDLDKLYKAITGRATGAKAQLAATGKARGLFRSSGGRLQLDGTGAIVEVAEEPQPEPEPEPEPEDDQIRVFCLWASSKEGTAGIGSSMWQEFGQLTKLEDDGLITHQSRTCKNLEEFWEHVERSQLYFGAANHSLWFYRVHVVQMSGHGADGNAGPLKFEADLGETHTTESAEARHQRNCRIAEHVCKYLKPVCVILNACESSDFAHALNEIDPTVVVICWASNAEITTCETLTRQFYQTLKKELKNEKPLRDMCLAAYKSARGILDAKGQLHTKKNRLSASNGTKGLTDWHGDDVKLNSATKPRRFDPESVPTAATLGDNASRHEEHEDEFEVEPWRKDWGELSLQEQTAAEVLGEGALSWPPGPTCKWPAWEDLTAQQQAAAATLGHDADDWPPELLDSDDEDHTAWAADTAAEENDAAFASSVENEAKLAKATSGSWLASKAQQMGEARDRDAMGVLMRAVQAGLLSTSDSEAIENFCCNETIKASTKQARISMYNEAMRRSLFIEGLPVGTTHEQVKRLMQSKLYASPAASQAPDHANGLCSVFVNQPPE